MTILRQIAVAALLVGSTTQAGAQLRPTDPNKIGPYQRERASELFKELKAKPDDHARRTEIVREMSELGRGVAQKMFDILDRQWGPKWDDYRKAFREAAGQAAKSKTTTSAKSEASRLEAKVRSLRNRGGLSKEMIKNEGDPALERLRELKVLTIQEILAADPELPEKREEILAIAQQRDYCIDALVMLDDEAPPFGSKDLKAFEDVTASAALGPPAEHLAILSANERLRGKVPAAEIEGVRDLNVYRILIGLRPVAIDAKLCDASRDHSKDMAEKGFFSHDSPIAGKETPWKRASAAGTSANSENIFVGSSKGASANRAWWYSPGHHKNMLAPGARRVGMGVHGNHWTQMFGG